jgi:4-amino-4-deoxy-L-arabinose transferase-like glycosyltransferase
MSRTLAQGLIILTALTHATFFIIYQSPDWNTEWTDQIGYTRLGQALAETGRFSRYPYDPRFIPEVIRTPGYPFFVAAVNRVIGQGHLAVAAAQAVVFAAICLLVGAMTRLVASERTAFAAALLTSLYPPLPYFAALTLTEVFTTFLVTLGVYLWLRALRDGGGQAAAAGVILAWAALTRPSFQFLPMALVAAACAIAPRGPVARRRSVIMLAVCAAVLAPWLLYNAVYLKMLTFTPAGGIGRALWEGGWQVTLPGRVQATLTEMADTTPERAPLDHKVRSYADQIGMDAAPMLRYVHQWQDIRRIWTEPQEPWERARARVTADGEYRRVALENIRRDPVRHVWLRLTRGVLLLWLTEIPVRYSDINALPALAIRAIWFPQALLMLAAIGGLYALRKPGTRREAAAFAAVIVYVTAVHAALYSEARYALPAKPVVLLLATVAAARLAAIRTERAALRRGEFRSSEL